jgi:hypothetical protein
VSDGPYSWSIKTGNTVQPKKAGVPFYWGVICFNLNSESKNAYSEQEFQGLRYNSPKYAQYTNIDAKLFDHIVDGMWRGVNRDGTCQGAALSGYNVCGKTGTAQNSKGADHSTFISFAPRNNPKIAIAVYVEHGGFGSETAVPIASLIEEQYLTDTILRRDLLQRVKSQRISYPMYKKK